MFYLEVLRNQCGNHLHKFGWVFRRHVAQRRLAVLLPFRIGIIDEVLAQLIARAFLSASRIAALTGLPRDQPPSATLFRLCRITVIEFLRRLCCLFRIFGLLSNPRTGIAANDHGTSSAPGDTLAVYHDATQTIYLSQGWSGNTPAELSVLVHEMIHHFQNV